MSYNIVIEGNKQTKGRKQKMNQDTMEMGVEVDEVVEESYVTGYKIAGMLKDQGVTRKPQMIYNYIRNNLIKSVEVNGQRVVELGVAEEWVLKFSTKHGTK
jgi:hypothetical protein